MAKQIFFISSSLSPVSDSSGGSIVLYRHLKRFEQEGYQITFINCSPVNKNRTHFRQVNLEKKSWYPPLRKATPILTRIRMQLHVNALRKTLHAKQGDLIISLLEDHASYLAYILSRELNIPFYLFFHDDNIYNRYFKANILTQNQINKIILACKHFFVVSEPMKERILESGARAVSVVYPIPNGTITLAPRKSDSNFNIIISGMLLPYFFEKTIEKINQASVENAANLILVGNFEKAYKEQAENLGIQFHDRFEKQRELYGFLSANADVIIVFYSEDVDMEIRSKYSFPSRFVEYCHLNIPILIIAPTSAAIGKWALENSWIAYISKAEPEKISEMISKLKDPDFRLKCLADCDRFTSTDFNPDKIHQQIRAIIADDTV